MIFTEGCILCGRELVYEQATRQKQCSYCGEQFDSNVSCPADHFVCDNCHGAGTADLTERFCNNTKLTDPVAIANLLMKNPRFLMHGPEHHFLVPAVLLAAYYNSKGEARLVKQKKIAIARKRSALVPGGFCGTHGNCGAAVGAGIFVSIITGSTPLAEKEWFLSNRMTGEALIEVANSGGPRCCKRDTFISIRSAANFINEHMGIALKLGKISCDFSNRNKQCKFDECQFFPN